MRKSRCSRFLRLLVIPVALGCSAAYGKDFSTLSLEELGRLDVYTAGVMQAHIHRGGEWMFAYQYSTMRMEDNASGTNDVSTQEVLQDFMVTPIDMDMTMHMVHIMYAPSDRLTLAGMFHYMDREMRHVTRMGTQFTTHSNGPGDIEVGANYKFRETEGAQGTSSWIARLGLMLPTGSIDEEDFLPAAGQNAVLPYPMQLGSGSYQLGAGLGYTYYREYQNWGALFNVLSPLNENDANYRVGEKLEIKAWFTHAFSEKLSITGRGEYYWMNDYSGADERLNPNMVPTADPNRRGYQRLDLNVGLEWLVVKNQQGEHQLELLVGLPAWQNLHGPQLKTKSKMSFSWIFVF